MPSVPTIGQQPLNASSRLELTETLSEDTKNSYDVHLEILRLLKQIRDDQRDYMSLQRERGGVAYDIPRVAHDLWVDRADAWVGLDSQASSFWADVQVGKKFLEALVPNTTNLQRVKRNCRAYFAFWMMNYLDDSGLTALQIRSGQYPWPDTWKISRESHYNFEYDRNLCCRSHVSCASPSNFRDQFEFKSIWNSDAKDLPDMMRSDEAISGIIAQFSISRSFDSINLDSAVAIISLVDGDPYSLPHVPKFLDGHIAGWREQPAHDRCWARPLNIPEHSVSITHQEVMSGIFTHYMRSFIVDSSGNVKSTKPHAPSLKCLREYITFRGFYTGEATKLTEKRYSTALNILPLQKPAGHYVLVSICDGQQNDVRRMFDESPGGEIFSAHPSAPWKKYGIYPAGLYTGICMLQLQICAFIESWEQDWTCTVNHIDRMVSLNLNVLENDKHIRNLVLGNNSDDSVLYFKVLQLLSNFSDMVRAAPSYLDALWPRGCDRVPIDYWFSESYPHTEKTRQIINHNWEVVSQRQRDASNRIIQKLERTSNEVKSLQSGLFNVQSITEARKSRTLNKYLMVFTIVTIIFLPPTFVATFFGMHIFDADTVDTTQKIFWLVLGALSGGTYLLAALGLFGTNFSAEKQKERQANSTSEDSRERSSILIRRVIAWFEDTQRLVTEKMT
ncbi:hypothetical protein F5Y07DRAFT_398742 [Xylaria sp. FL0933]|nr:hypothetical protein F5Y07DRAFT_398742 [Xylaria sp. FL0933]